MTSVVVPVESAWTSLRGTPKLGYVICGHGAVASYYGRIGMSRLPQQRDTDCVADVDCPC